MSPMPGPPASMRSSAPIPNSTPPNVNRTTPTPIEEKRGKRTSSLSTARTRRQSLTSRKLLPMDSNMLTYLYAHALTILNSAFVVAHLVLRDILFAVGSDFAGKSALWGTNCALLYLIAPDMNSGGNAALSQFVTSYQRFLRRSRPLVFRPGTLDMTSKSLEPYEGCEGSSTLPGTSFRWDCLIRSNIWYLSIRWT